jgi:hypothetical protein
MTSSVFNHLNKLMKSDIFNLGSHNLNLRKIVDFYLGKNLLTADNKVFAEIRKETLLYVTKNNIEGGEFDVIRKYINTELPSLKNEGEFGSEDDYYEYLNSFSSFDENRNEEGAQDDSSERNFKTDPITKEEYINVLNDLDLIEERDLFMASISQAEIGYLNLLSKSLLDAVDEQKILGRLLGINQGIRTNSQEKYSFLRSVEVFINRKIENAKGVKKENFEVLQFIKDEGYKQY